MRARIWICSVISVLSLVSTVLADEGDRVWDTRTGANGDVVVFSPLERFKLFRTRQTRIWDCLGSARRFNLAHRCYSVVGTNIDDQGEGRVLSTRALSLGSRSYGYTPYMGFADGDWYGELESEFGCFASEIAQKIQSGQSMERLLRDYGHAKCDPRQRVDLLARRDAINIAMKHYRQYDDLVNTAMKGVAWKFTDILKDKRERDAAAAKEAKDNKQPAPAVKDWLTDLLEGMYPNQSEAQTRVDPRVQDDAADETPDLSNADAASSDLFDTVDTVDADSVSSEESAQE